MGIFYINNFWDICLVQDNRRFIFSGSLPDREVFLSNLLQGKVQWNGTQQPLKLELGNLVWQLKLQMPFTTCLPDRSFLVRGKPEKAMTVFILQNDCLWWERQEMISQLPGGWAMLPCYPASRCRAAPHGGTCHSPTPTSAQSSLCAGSWSLPFL